MSKIKAKKKVHPMPELGWKDKLLYGSILFLLFWGSVPLLFWANAFKVAMPFHEPGVIAYAENYTGLGFWLLPIWCLAAGLTVYAKLCHPRIPVFGRSDIKYGPPAWPRTYPLLMKNKPHHWVSPSQLAREKRSRRLLLLTFAVSLLICGAMFPFSLYRRAVLRENGTIVIYEQMDKKIQDYAPDSIIALELEVVDRGSMRNSNWGPELTVTTEDGERFSFHFQNFSGDDTHRLQTMLQVKQMYDVPISISDQHQLWKTIADQHLTSNEQALLYRLFDTQP